MLITVKELKELYPEFQDMNEKLLERKLSALEQTIRKYANNNFQIRAIRSDCFVQDEKIIPLKGFHRFKVGDTVEINVDCLNEGLCVVETATDTYITVDKELYDSSTTLVTKVEYPLDIIEGAINMLKWDTFDRDKVGVASETISRHSVSYQQYDGSNTIDGYPAMLLGFCTPYMRART